MKKITQIIAFMFILLSISNVNAQDEKLISRVLNQLNLKPKDVNIDFIQTKVLPYATAKTVLVIPKYQTRDEKDDFYVYDAYVIVADNQSGQILNKYFESQKWVSDAFRLEGFEIDTGLYKLNENVRAFGVRVSYNGSSRVFPLSETNLSLYIPTKNGLKEIANEINVNHYSAEWDGNCQGESQNHEITIDIDKEKNNGFYNLILRNKFTNKITIPKDDDCIESVSITNETKKLKYNGKTYK